MTTWWIYGPTTRKIPFIETPILWSPDMKSWLIGKDPDAGKDGRQKEKEKEEAEDEMLR